MLGANPVSGVAPGHLAYLIYTSGSTGQPKGVMVTHLAVVRLFLATEHWFQFGPQDVWTMFHSFAFDFSVWEIWGALLFGGRLVVVPYWKSRSPAEFHDILVREKVTVLNQTPSAFRQLAAAEEMVASREPLNLRLVILGGEALASGILKSWFDRHGDERPQLVNMYGITETTVHVTYRRMRLVDCQGPSVIGEPIPDLELLLLDSDQQIVPVGTTGEIHVGGAGLARGYWQRPELTIDRFIQHPFRKDPGARLYKSGDLARYLPDGDLEFLGRADQQVKIRGFRIELGEIEARLREHADVREAVVLAREDSPDDKRLVAYYTGAAAVKVEVLRRHLEQRLPDYMVPAAYVKLDALPLTPHGKLDHKALRERETEARTVRAGKVPQRVVASRTLTERKLLQIWERVLGIRPIGVHDSFFDLGGHSMRAVQLIWEVQKAFKQTVSVASLFAAPTIEQFARLLARGELDDSLTHAGKLCGAKTGTPLFHMPGLRGVEFLPEALAREIGRVCPYCDSLQLVGLDGQQPPLNRVEEMAAQLVTQIRRICPEGPYGLSGYSFGGLLAFEAARQLRAQGFEVETLVLWDSFTAEAMSMIRRSLPQAVSHLSRCLRAASARERPRLLWNLLQERMELLVGRYSNKAAARVWRASMQAFEAYRPDFYAGSAIVIRASLPTESVFHRRLVDELNGWRELIRGHLEFIELPCDHAGMWQEPMVTLLAKETAECLQQKRTQQQNFPSRNGSPTASNTPCIA